MFGARTVEQSSGSCWNCKILIKGNNALFDEHYKHNSYGGLPYPAITVSEAVIDSYPGVESNSTLGSDIIVVSEQRSDNVHVKLHPGMLFIIKKLEIG